MNKGIYVLTTKKETADQKLAQYFEGLMNIVEKSSQSSEDKILLGGAMMSVARILYHDELGQHDGNALFDSNTVDFIELIKPTIH
tara:strand:+ start:26 stop:280 length:255 start_codon:yes stop_codon:yes gene_type:complete